MQVMMGNLAAGQKTKDVTGLVSQLLMGFKLGVVCREVIVVLKDDHESLAFNGQGSLVCVKIQSHVCDSVRHFLPHVK